MVRFVAVPRRFNENDWPRGIVANTLNVSRNGAVGFIDWLGLAMEKRGNVEPED